MARLTPIKDFLFRMEVDPDFVKRVLDPEQRDDAFEEYELSEAARDAIVNKNFAALQSLVEQEDTGSHTVHVLPRGWVA
jgi:hypothetical protein